MARIEHPNVIAIYDADAWGDELYIAMRYVPRGDLRAALAGGPLEPARALSILAQAASGLDAAHEHGLVHRDVKPANIMLDGGGRPGAPEAVYVTDFGLTKHVESSARATPTGVLLGTVDYVAPEQVEGRAPDGRADVYSLGCVAFECLTGRRPFERENEAAVLWAHMQEKPPPVSGHAPEVGSGLDEPIARALAKDPDERFATCGEFAEALRDPIEAAVRRAGSAEAERRVPAWPRMLAAALAGLVLGAAGVGAAFLADGTGTPGPAAATAEPRTVVSTVVTTVVETPPEQPPAFIPQQFRNRCRVAGPQTSDFDSSYVCSLEGPVETVRYSHAVSGPALAAHLRHRMERAGLTPPAADQPIVAQGSCAEQELPAIEDWVKAGRAGHQPAGELEVGRAEGRVLCYQFGGLAHIEWTTGVLGVYAHAYGRRFSPLYEWWGVNSGPVS